MTTFLDWAALCVSLFWIALALDRKRWWPTSARLPDGDTGTGEALDGLLIVIPARNEADTLQETLPSLLVQSHDFDQLVLVDDNSNDGTAAQARRIIEALPEAREKASVLAAPLPPAGWTGKLHALQCGLAEMSASADYEWVLFTDADIRHPPASLAALAQKARQGFDLVSVMVKLRSRTFWEKVLIPPFIYFFQLLYPFRRVADPESRVAAAAGGCVLLKRELLDVIGGLASIRSAVIDDVSLARAVKRAGGRCWLGIDPAMESWRGYESFGRS